MDCFIHDLSLNGQFQTPQEFLQEIKALLDLRDRYPIVRDSLYCTRALSSRPATATQNLREVAGGAQRDLRLRIINWLMTKGPFLDNSRLQHADDYFECDGHDVTDQGAGEAARRLSAKLASCMLSFPGGGYDSPSLEIHHGIPENRLGRYEIANFWQHDALRIALNQAQAKPQNWSSALSQASQRFPDLLISPEILVTLQRESFSSYVAERIFELLGILQEFIAVRDKGSYSQRNWELIDHHFSGNKAWFTDESDSNKREFAEQLSFVDPYANGAKIFCPWHGKIKTPQFRIHFTPWPLSTTDKKIKVLYIGPKITKG